MRPVWTVIKRTVFWSQERGTGPYDVLVGAILLFLFFSPRSWFHDQTQIGPAPHSGQVLLQREDAAAGTRAYRVDLHLLLTPPRSTELERRAHELLQKNVEELRGRTFQIVRMEPVTGEDGTLLYYDIWVKP